MWMQRLCAAFPRLVWLNPETRQRWDYTPSVRITRELVRRAHVPAHDRRAWMRPSRELRTPLERCRGRRRCGPRRPSHSSRSAVP